MSLDICVSAPAKVNLGLKVLPRRGDGYHDIESIFQTVGLYDRLTVSPLQKKNTCVVLSPGFDDLPQENTLTKTYKSFCAFTGCDFGVQVILEKHIPSGGGLGGGSSDAASFLKALAHLNQIPLTDELADKVAGQVGSDVFFFLHSGENQNKNGCAVVTGRGDVVKPIPSRNDLFFLLVFPGVHSSTKEAYELLDKSYESNSFTVCPNLTDLERIYNGSVKDWAFANSFTSVLLQKYPEIGSALGNVKNSGAVWADMSGSGATVFGVYDSKQGAEKAYSLLCKRWNCCLVG